MSVPRWLTVAVVILTAVLLGGCFTASFPILEPADGDAFPGGPGTLRLLDEEGKPQGRLVVSAIKGQGQRYRVRSESTADGRTKVEEGELIVKSVSGDLYLVQFKDSEDKYFYSPAVITPEKFTIMVVDAETLAKIATKHGLKIVQQPASGDVSATGSIQETSEPALVQTLDGPVIQAPKDVTLAIAREMAASDEAVPLDDGNYVRQAK